MIRSLTASGTLDYQEWLIEDSGASVMVRVSCPETMVYQLQNDGDDPIAPIRVLVEAQKLAADQGATTLVIASEELDSPTKTKWLIRNGFTPQMIVMAKQITEEECPKQHQL